MYLNYKDISFEKLQSHFITLSITSQQSFTSQVSDWGLHRDTTRSRDKWCPRTSQQKCWSAWHPSLAHGHCSVPVCQATNRAMWWQGLYGAQISNSQAASCWRLEILVMSNASYWCFVRYLSFFRPPFAYPRTISVALVMAELCPSYDILKCTDHAAQFDHTFLRPGCERVQPNQVKQEALWLCSKAADIFSDFLSSKSKRSVQSGCVKHNVQFGSPKASGNFCAELDQFSLVFSKLFCFTTLQVTTKTGDTSHLLEPKNRICGFLWAEPMLRGLLPWVPQAFDWKTSHARAKGQVHLAARSIPTTWTKVKL